MNEVRSERSGWRDEEISRRHRAWGFNCPTVDLDFVMVEYNHGKPVAIIEYKEQHAHPIDPQHATYRALVSLADGYVAGPLPCFVAIYNSQDWSFRVVPLNERARQHYAHVLGATLSERRFVKSLYLLRKAALSSEDEAVIAKLHGAVPASTANPNFN